MAHVVGVPKRDPCQSCGLPVFLAERLTVAKLVYHRTCLKCARCKSQLTPGSFYETEVDGEYCCETCPDEETTLDVEGQSILRGASPDSFDSKVSGRPKTTTVRSSIADRLAFFEQGKESPSASSSSKLLQKSLSDEEKSKSLKKMNEETSSPQYKMNSALSSFMSSTLNDDIDAGDDTSMKKMDTSESVTSISDSDNDEEDEEDNEEEENSDQKPPQLPLTLPPPIITSKPTTLERKIKPKPPMEEQKPEEPRTTTAEIMLHPSNQMDEHNDNERIVEESISTTSITLARTADDRNLSKSKSNFVTKDNTEPDEQMRTTNATIVVDSTAQQQPEQPPSDATAAGPAEEVKANEQLLDSSSITEEEKEKDKEILREKPPLRQRPVTLDIIKTNGSNDVMAGHEDEETTNRLSVVRARLHQFEVIANNKSTNDNNVMHRTPETSSSASRSSFKSDNNSVRSATSAAESAPQQNGDEDEDEHTNESIEAMPSSSVAEVELKSVEVPRNVEIEVKAEEIPAKETVENDCKEQQPTACDTNVDTAIPPCPEEVAAVKVEEKMDDSASKAKEEPIAMEIVEKPETTQQHPPIAQHEVQKKPFTSPAKVNLELYPEELNPFKSDDENDDQIAPLPASQSGKPITPAPRRSLPSPASSKKEKDTSNPFDSSDDEVEIEKKVKPPRPPPPKISKNPFGSESEGEENFSSVANVGKKTPVPAPRSNVSLSQNPTPEPTPRLSSKQPSHHATPLNNTGEFYGSSSSLGSTPYSLQRNTEVRGSNNSLTSSTGTIRSRKSRKGPAPPPPVKELFPSTETLDSKLSSPSSSNSTTPHQGRKKRPAPAPPKPARLHDAPTVLTSKTESTNDTGPKNSLSYPLQSDLDKLSDEEKALLEGNRLERTSEQTVEASATDDFEDKNSGGRKLIPLDLSLVSDPDDLLKQTEVEENNVVYRRTIMPAKIVTPTHEEPVSHDRQLEKMKDNKEAQNRNRQSQASSGAEDTDPLYNKSSHGKWKRRKGPAPALPIPPRKVLQMLPLQEIRHELDIIEVQQQGLEKQGVILEKMIRDRCEGKNGELEEVDSGTSGPVGPAQNSKEVEDLILQLFELVNEKNELFRRQAELMYLRRQHRLEQEQADLEYEIRVLMAQPERNKTDSDKAREEALIARLVEVVQLRNEVVECLEMDRLREAEEDLSIKQRLEIHTAKREQEMSRHTLSKLSKKEKKKQKEAKKLGKSKKLDADKDADESELSVEMQKTKKKKKKFLF